jgi:hypothetical protein
VPFYNRLRKFSPLPKGLPQGYASFWV